MIAESRVAGFIDTGQARAPESEERCSKKSVFTGDFGHDDKPKTLKHGVSGGNGGDAIQIARIATIAKQSKLKIPKCTLDFLAILARLAIASKIPR